MKHSKQRELIYTTVCEKPTHPSAEEIYTRVKHVMPAIGLATVYRNLNVLVETSRIHRLKCDSGFDRFDGNTEAHPHFQCLRCGAFYDLDRSYLDGIREKLAQNSDFVVEKLDLTVRGYCCRDNKKVS